MTPFHTSIATALYRLSARLLLVTLMLGSLPLMKGSTPRGATDKIEFSSLQVIAQGDSEETIAEKAAKVLPRPNQSKWMRYERTFFLHFGPNTFRGVEWGNGQESPALFAPTALDAKQWVGAVKNAGGKLIILVAKHHDGLCLWPSRYTDHSIAASPWRSGKGDLVREVAETALAQGIRLGIYLSPADLYQLRTNPITPRGLYGNGSPEVRSTIPTSPESFLKDPSRGRQPARGFDSLTYEADDYNRYFLNQLYELLTDYGPISAVWFDGANPDPSVHETYDYASWYDLIHKLQPDAVISVKGPDVRWVGNEGGHGRTTEWSVLPLSEPPSVHTWPDRQQTDLGSRALLSPGSYLWWYPAEVNTPILNGWFWSPEKRVKSPAELVDYYYRSVGRNGNMLLNLSPDTRGLIPDDQLASLGKMSQVVNDTFARNLSEGALLSADSSDAEHQPAAAQDTSLDTWWEAAAGQYAATFTLTLTAPVAFDVVSLQEAVDYRSQRIEAFVIETWNGSAWSAPQTLEEQTTIGHKRLVRFATPVSTDKVRIRVLRSRLEPTLAEVGLFKQSLPKEPLISDRSRDGLVSLSHPHHLRIVYTLDGSQPTVQSPSYTGPLSLPEGGTLNAAVVTKEGTLGLVATKTIVGFAPTGWKIIGRSDQAANSDETAAANAIDAEAGTAWKERATTGAAPRPSLTVDMGSARRIGGFAYLPRQDWVFVGIVDRYKFETSLDGSAWTTQIAEGSFGNIRNNPTLQEISFATVEARFFRFTALHDVDDNGWIGASELTVLPPREETREIRSLDANWRFHLGEERDATLATFNDANWRVVDVPHDYVVEGSFSENNPAPNEALDPSWYWLHGFLPLQPAVYRKTLDIPAEARGKRLWLEFDGVNSNSQYWLNGRQIGTQYSGYTRTRFDITDAANYGGGNLLVVKVDPRYDGWWYEGGGIYRHVRLVTVNSLHIAPDGVFVAPSIAKPGQGNQADARVQAKTDISNASSKASSVSVESEILNARDEVVARGSSISEIGASSTQSITQDIPLPGATLWSPENPYLYRLRSSLRVNGREVDQVVTSFGVRHVRFDAEEGLFLNGRPLKLQGVNMHQDHAGVGVAMPDRLFTWRLERLKEVGCNAIRMSHNPVTPFLLDECDRLGFLVIAENRHLGDSRVDQTPKNAPALVHQDLSSMVLRDRNHPCIMLWSLCNEQWIQGTPEAASMARAMKQRVHELDPTRPVTAAMNGGFDSTEGMGGVLDVIGINYNPWVYDPVHALFPKTPLIASEIASEISTRGVYAVNHWEDYYGDRARGYVSAYSISAGPAGQTVENAWPPVASRAFLGGGFVWAAFDYKGEPRPFGWPVINCHYGFMDLCGFPKDNYYYYKAQWTKEPVLHLFPHWNWEGMEGQEIPVWVHTNCEEVELFLNGNSLGRQKTTPLRHLEWKVNFAPGRLVARGLHHGQWTEVAVQTTGVPKALRLSADRKDLQADNADLAIIKIEAVDAQGLPVPTANNKVSFSLTGPAKLIGVGNGDPTCHEPDKGDSRSLFNGLAQALVQTTHTAGAITVKAEAPGLLPCELTLQSH